MRYLLSLLLIMTAMTAVTHPDVHAAEPLLKGRLVVEWSSSEQFVYRLLPFAQDWVGLIGLSRFIPGLIMLQVIDQTYGESSSSLFQGRFMYSIQELLVSPLSACEIVTGFIVSSILRALLIAMLIMGVGFVMVHTFPQNWVLFFGMIVLVSTLFGAIGIIFGLLAEKFDHIAAFTTFVITPLVFVGGVFTSAQFLPPLVRRVSLVNPMFYMIDAFRFAFTGRSDVPVLLSIGIVVTLAVVSLAIALRMTALGYKLRV